MTHDLIAWALGVLTLIGAGLAGLIAAIGAAAIADHMTGLDLLGQLLEMLQ